MYRIGEKIHYYRTMRNMSRKELVEGICHESTLYRIETSQVLPELPTVKMLCRKLNIPIHLLFEEVLNDNDRKILHSKQQCRNYVYNQNYEKLYHELLYLQDLHLFQYNENHSDNLFLKWHLAILLHKHKDEPIKAKRILKPLLPNQPLFDQEVAMIDSLGSIYLDLKQWERALYYCEKTYKSIKNISVLKDPRLFVVISYNYATCLYNLDKIHLTKEICFNIISFLKQHHLVYMKGETLYLLGKANKKVGNVYAAWTKIDKAIRYFTLDGKQGKKIKAKNSLQTLISNIKMTSTPMRDKNYMYQIGDMPISRF